MGEQENYPNHKGDITHSGYGYLIDAIVQDQGLVAAAVYAVIERFARREKGFCYASLATIAKALKVSRKTVQRHLPCLLANGYIQELNPELSGSTREFVTTGRVRIKTRSQAEIHGEDTESGGYGQIDQGGMDTESEGGRTQSPPKSTSSKSTSTKRINDDSSSANPRSDLANALCEICDCSSTTKGFPEALEYHMQQGTTPDRLRRWKRAENGWARVRPSNHTRTAPWPSQTKSAASYLTLTEQLEREGYRF
jgi:hypothetical protein